MRGWTERPYKAKVRDYLLDVPGPRRLALFLPGWDLNAGTGCLCVQRGLVKGTIDRDTQIIAVERNAQLANNIAGQLATMGFTKTPRLWRGELHDLVLDASDRLDYASFDLFGSVDLQVAGWLAGHVASHLARNACLAFTFTGTWRNNHFMTLSSYAWKTVPELRTRALRYADCHGINDSNVLTNLIILRSLFPNHEFPYRRAQVYRDVSRTMVAVRIEQMQRRAKAVWPSANEVLDHLKTGARIMTSIAAKKTSKATGSKAQSTGASSDLRPISFDDIPNRAVLEQATLALLDSGVSNSDAMREAICEERQVVLEQPPSGNWNGSPTGKFINEHAHVLRKLMEAGVIRKIGSKHYSRR
jgi:hypothetical protein